MAECAASGRPFAAVTLVEAIGSTPQDAGSKMLVDADGIVFGTVGGGRLENQAIGFAQQLLSGENQRQRALEEWNLQRDVGMTCGGVVKLYFEAYNRHTWRIVLFGAGHVAQQDQHRHAHAQRFRQQQYQERKHGHPHRHTACKR